MSWEQVKIQDIFEVARGGSPRPIDDFITNDENGVNWIMIGDTKNSGKYIYKTAKKIKPEGAKKSREVKEGDFLLTNSMSFGRPYILKTSGCIHDGWLVLSPVDENIYTDYFYYYLGSDEIKLKLSSKAAGAVVKNLNKEIVNNLKIPLPPLDQQKQIASILDTADAYRQKTKALIEKYDALTQSLFLDMFGGPVTNPMGWDVSNLGSLTTLITDGKHGNCNDEPNSGYYFVSAKDIRNDKINFHQSRQIPKNEFEEVDRRTNLQPGDLVMINTGATIGRMAIADNIPETRRCTFQKSVAVIKVKPEYLRSIFLKYVFELRLLSFASKGSGSAIKNLLLSEMRRFNIIIPNINLQNQFAKRVKAIEAQKVLAQQELDKADELFNSLLQKAFKEKLVK